MDRIEWILPLALIIISFLLKLMIGRNVGLGECIETMIELPNEIVLQGTVFIIVFTISPHSDTKMGLLLFIIYIVFLIFLSFCRRKAIDFHRSQCPKKPVILTIAGIIISAVLLAYSIKIINGVWLNGL